MTKVTLHYDLLRSLDDDDAEAVAKAHSVYGFFRVSVKPDLKSITVDYDASRLSERDVEEWLIRVGVPLKRQPMATA
jgi:copper chaperone CopZ